MLSPLFSFKPRGRAVRRFCEFESGGMRVSVAACMVNRGVEGLPVSAPAATIRRAGRIPDLQPEGCSNVQIDSVEQVVFYLIAIIAVVGALGVVFSNDIVHSALALVLTLLMTAGVYVLLSAEFLGLVQILVYGGGVSILVLFAVMITRVRDSRDPLTGAQKPFAVAAGLAVAAALTLMVVNSDWRVAASRIGDRVASPNQVTRVTTIFNDQTVQDTRAIGHDLFRNFAVPIEVASLVLLVALVGAIIIARGEEDEVA